MRWIVVISLHTYTRSLSFYSRHLLIPHLFHSLLTIFFGSTTDNIEFNRNFCVWNFINSLFTDNMSSSRCWNTIKILNVSRHLYTSHMPFMCMCVCVWCADLVHCISYMCVCVGVFHFLLCQDEKKTFLKALQCPKKNIFDRKQTHSHIFWPPKRWLLHCEFSWCHVCIRPRLSVFLPKFIPWPSLLSLPSSPSSLVLSPLQFHFFVCRSFFFYALFTLNFWLFFCVPFYTFYLCILQFFISPFFS